MAAQFSIRGTCKARPEVVYAILANVQTHLEWNGERQAKDFRLMSLSAPAGLASVGTVFESTGSIPMTKRRWHDRSTVITADSPHLFEFRTEAVVPFENGDRMNAVLLHRYQVEVAPGGSSVVYTMKLESMTNGMWRLRLPIVRTMAWKIGIPMATKRGFRALLQMAEAAKSQPNGSVQQA